MAIGSAVICTLLGLASNIASTDLRCADEPSNSSRKPFRRSSYRRSAVLSARKPVQIAAVERVSHADPELGRSVVQAAAPVDRVRRTGERGVEVCLVEYLAAADHVAFDVEKLTARHSASKPSCEVPCATSVMTTPRSLSRCTASMWTLDVRHDLPRRTDERSQVTRLERCRRPMVDVDPVRRRRG